MADSECDMVWNERTKRIWAVTTIGVLVLFFAIGWPVSLLVASCPKWGMVAFVFWLIAGGTTVGTVPVLAVQKFSKPITSEAMGQAGIQADKRLKRMLVRAVIPRELLWRVTEVRRCQR